MDRAVLAVPDEVGEDRTLELDKLGAAHLPAGELEFRMFILSHAADAGHSFVIWRIRYDHIRQLPGH